jgi:hypothetical protein
MLLPYWYLVYLNINKEEAKYRFYKKIFQLFPLKRENKKRRRNGRTKENSLSVVDIGSGVGIGCCRGRVYPEC